jgi:hypothetical protein
MIVIDPTGNSSKSVDNHFPLLFFGSNIDWFALIFALFYIRLEFLQFKSDFGCFFSPSGLNYSHSCFG